MKKHIYIITLFVVLLIVSCGKVEKPKTFPPNSPEFKGLDIFLRMSCNACHSIDGSLKLGPTIKNQYGKEIRHTDGTVMIIDDKYLRESIIFPLKHIVDGYTPIMPSYRPILKDEEINYLIAYMKVIN